MQNYIVVKNDELYHHGIKGQKWGIRRFQNPDGTLTEAGKNRIRSKAGSYLNPPKKKTLSRDDTSRRNTVANDFSREYQNESYYWSKLAGRKKENGDVEPYWGDIPEDYEMEKIWAKYFDRYASATLKDLRMEDTEKSREWVSWWFKSNEDSYLDYIDRKTLGTHGEGWGKDQIIKNEPGRKK